MMATAIQITPFRNKSSIDRHCFGPSKMDQTPLLFSLCAIGAIAIFVSFFGLSEKPKRQDHRSRTLATAGIALVSISVAIGSYYGREWSELERARKAASSTFFESMLKFGVTAKHLDAMRAACELDSPRRSPANDACKASADLASRFSSSLPSLESTLNLVAKSTTDLASIHLITRLLIDGEIALKVRMPASIDLGIRRASPPNADFRRFVYDFQEKAEDVSVIYCLFGESADDSWLAFNDLLRKINQEDFKAANLDLKARIDLIAKGKKFQNIPCNAVRENVDQALPVGSGGGN